MFLGAYGGAAVVGSVWFLVASVSIFLPGDIFEIEQVGMGMLVGVGSPVMAAGRPRKLDCQASAYGPVSIRELIAAVQPLSSKWLAYAFNQ